MNRPSSTFCEKTPLKTACPSTRQGMSLAFAIALLGLPATDLSAQSSLNGFTVTMQQEGTNVVATGSGELNLSALMLEGSNYEAFPWVSGKGIELGPDSVNNKNVWGGGIISPSSFGSGRYSGGIGSGSTVGCADGIDVDNVSITGVALIVPLGYVSDTALSDSATWSDETIAGLGLTPGTYTWSWGSGSTASFFTLDIVPEPDSMILLGVGGLAVAAYRRKIRAK